MAKKMTRKKTRGTRTRPKPRKTRPRKAAAARKRRPAVKKTARKATRPAARKAPVKTARKTASKTPRRKAAEPHAPGLHRPRRILPETERLEPKGPAPDERLIASARAGHNELQAERLLHTEASPALAGGDVDAKWQDAYAIGDEAPGGDNPTPGQDRVDDIGKALGIQYQDDQELQGGEEVTERDRHRWELDPASSDDWPHEKKKP